MRRRAFAASLAAGATHLATRSAAAQPQPASTLSIGFIAALTGPGQSWGVSMLGGLEMAAEDVNGKGGLTVGGKPHLIKVIAYDDKYAGPPAAQAAQRLISSDGVNIIVGPLGSVSMLAIADITESSKTIVLSNTYTMKALSADKPYTFRLTPTTAEFADPFIAWIAKARPEIKSVSVISPNDDSGKEVVAASQAGYGKHGIKVNGVEYYERGTQDFVPVLTRMLASKPDMIDLDGSTPVESGMVMKQAKQIGFAGQFIKVGGPGVADMVRIAADAADGLYYYSPWDPADPKIAAISARFKALKKIPFNPLGIFFYDGGHMLLDAIAKAGSSGSDAVKKQIEAQAEFNGLLGRYVWGGEATYGIRHQWIAPFYVGQIAKGEETVVARIDA